MHTKNVFTSPQITLYINAKPFGSKYAPFVSSSEKTPHFIFGRKTEKEEFERSFSVQVEEELISEKHLLYNLISNEEKWNLGNTYLIAENLSHEVIATIFFLGFNYSGNFKSSFHPYQTSNIYQYSNLKLVSKYFFQNNFSSVNPLSKPLSLFHSSFPLAEEKIIFSFNPKNYFIDFLDNEFNASSYSSPQKKISASSNLKSPLLSPSFLILNKQSYTSLNPFLSSSQIDRYRNKWKKEINKIINGITLPLQFNLSNISSFYLENSATLDGAKSYIISSFSNLLRRMGGISILFHLISKANQSSFLPLLKLLVSSIKQNFWINQELSQPHGSFLFLSFFFFVSSLFLFFLKNNFRKFLSNIFLHPQV